VLTVLRAEAQLMSINLRGQVAFCLPEWRNPRYSEAKSHSHTVSVL
jgi:hypothetical protein